MTIADIDHGPVPSAHFSDPNHELTTHLDRLRDLDAQTSVPAPPSVSIALDGRHPSLLPPSTRRAVIDLTDEQATATYERLVLSLSDSPTEPRAFDDAVEALKVWDMRRAEDRMIPHRANVVRKWRDKAKQIKVDAPPIPNHGCLWHVVQIASDDPSIARSVGSKCGTLTCPHCAPLWHSHRLADAIDAFEDCETVTVLALEDDEARKRFAERHKKRRQRLDGVPLAKHDLAMVTPVLDGRFFAIAGHADRNGQRVPLATALEMLDNAITDRIALAQLTGKDADARKVSWPGKPSKSTANENVPNFSVEESNEGDNRDKCREWTTVGGTDQPLTVANIAAVLDGVGLTAKVRRYRKGELRIEAEDLNAVIESLTKSFHLRDRETLAESHSERRARIAWENATA